MKKTLNKIFGIIPYIILLAAFILIISLTSALKKGETPTIFGTAIFVVVSPSMEDTIMVGDVIFVDTTPDKLFVGDIITFHKPGEENVIITHRIIEINEVNGEREYTTQGDNNYESLDWEIGFSEDFIIGKYQSKSNLLGSVYQFMFANGYTLIFFVIIGVFLIIGGMELFNIIKQLSLAKEQKLLEEKERMIQDELERLRRQREEDKE